jgi:hypothetical protein
MFVWLQVEDRNEELAKLRKKLTQTVQVLTHVREKLQFVETEATVSARCIIAAVPWLCSCVFEHCKFYA